MDEKLSEVKWKKLQKELDLMVQEAEEQRKRKDRDEIVLGIVLAVFFIGVGIINFTRGNGFEGFVFCIFALSCLSSMVSNLHINLLKEKNTVLLGIIDRVNKS